VEVTLSYSVAGYEDRAQECAKLANQAKDQMIRVELLKLRQTYLNIAERLRRQGFEAEYPPPTAVRVHNG
jgi:hypothetical protein